ncbi:MAG: HEPN domain-containing protein [Pseudomonadota bacterium]|nr:HEPN domain-containing protein [Pseudomonadota bacterium]
MTADELARAYRAKASKRRRVLGVLLEEEGYSDVVREAQELVELALKGMLRIVGIDPPKWPSRTGTRIRKPRNTIG